MRHTYFVLIIPVLILLTLSPASAASAWVSLDTNISKTSASSETPILQIDSNNMPHVVWEESGEIYYRKWNGGQWVSVSGNAGAIHPDINASNEFFDNATPHFVLDSTDTPHLVYISTTGVAQIPTFYKTWNGSNWVDIQGNTGITTDLNISIGYVTFAGAFFTTTTPRVDVNSSGVPFISFYDSIAGSQSKAIKWGGSAWVNMSNAASNDANANPTALNGSASVSSLKIKLDSNGDPVFVWNSGGAVDETILQKWDTLAGWVSVDGSGGALDPDSNVSNTPLESLGPVAFDLNASDDPYVVWLETNFGVNEDVVLHHWAGTSWLNMADTNGVGADFNVSQHSATATADAPDIAVSSTNIPFVVWEQGAAITVRKWSGSLWVDPAGNGSPWASQNVFNVSGSTGSVPSIALDSKDRPHVVWQDNFAGNNEVRYSVWDNPPDINITKIDGVDVNTAFPTFSTQQDGNITITFNVSDLDQDDLNVNLWYSTTAGGYGTVIVSDLNLSGSECASTDFTSTVACTYDLNASGITDGNFFIDAVLNDGYTTDTNSTPVSFQVDNSGPSAVTFTSPAAGAVLASGTTLVTVQYTGDANTTKFWLRLGDTGLYEENGTNTDYNVTTIDSNSYTVYAIAMDGEDHNSSAATLSFSIGVPSPSGGGTFYYCGDGICTPAVDETEASCPQDCAPVCGDNQCTGTESVLTCPRDCAIGCGNLICEENESCSTCPRDCGECAIDSPDAETIRQRTLLQQPTLTQISELFSSLGKSSEAARQALDNHTLVTVSREVLVQRNTRTGEISSTLSIILNNTTASEIRNVKVIEHIPKSVAASPDEIRSSYFFAVLEEDPVIQFTISSIRPDGSAKVIYTVEGELSETQINAFFPAIISELTSFADGLTCENLNCNDDNPCTLDRCFNTECSYLAVADGTTCGFGRECRSGICRNLSVIPAADGGADFTLILLVVLVVLIAAGFFYTRMKGMEGEADEIAAGLATQEKAARPLRKK